MLCHRCQEPRVAGELRDERAAAFQRKYRCCVICANTLSADVDMIAVNRARREAAAQAPDRRWWLRRWFEDWWL